MRDMLSIAYTIFATTASTTTRETLTKRSIDRA